MNNRLLALIAFLIMSVGCYAIADTYSIAGSGGTGGGVASVTAGTGGITVTGTTTNPIINTTSGGTVTSVSGTTNRVTVTNPTTTPALNVGSEVVTSTSQSNVGFVPTITGANVWTWAAQAAGNFFWAPTTTCPDLRLPINIWKVQPGTTTASIFGTTAWTVAPTGTPAALSDTTGAYVDYPTSATLNTDGGLTNSNVSTSPQLKPRIWFKIKTPTSIATMHLMGGLTTSFGAEQSADAATSTSKAMFRYSTNATDTTFKLVVSNGSAATVVDSTVPVVADTAYTICVDESDPTKVSLWINGTNTVQTSTNMPSTTAAMFPMIQTRTLSATASSIRIGGIFQDSN